MPNEDHYRAAPGRARFAVVTVSDSRSEASDIGGARLIDLLRRQGQETTRKRLVPDEPDDLRQEVEAALAAAEVDCVLVTGGTGISPRDVTIEAVVPLFDKELSGFGEIFRALSFAEIGPAAMLSRATAGVVGGKAVFLLPGSPAALELAMHRLILPEIGHLLGQARRAG